MLVVALVQGAALYALHLALDEKVWPATDFRWLFPLYALATIIPLVIHLDVMYLDVEIICTPEVRVPFLPVLLPATARWARTHELSRRCG